MSFELDAGHLDLQAQARALASTVTPFAAEADACSSVHEPTLAALKDSGLLRLAVPRLFGGSTEQVDPLAICVIREVLMGSSSHLDALFAMQGIGSYAITAAGSSAQQETWLPRIASGEVLPALALTEPQAGSDLSCIESRLREANGSLVLSGRKSFISNAGAAAFYVVLAREASGMSLVLVPADASGLTVEPANELIAPHVLGDLEFDGVKLPSEARIGAPGEAMRVVRQTLSVFRASVAGAATGLAQAALDEAVAHARARHQFGRPLIEIDAVGQMLAKSWTEVELSRLISYRAASRAAHDPLAALTDSSMAKVAATEMAARVLDRCVQVMGRFGLVRGAKIERLYRAARPMRIYEGATEVIHAGLARELARRTTP
jgi:acyl-CoA dehydrogenase